MARNKKTIVANWKLNPTSLEEAKKNAMGVRRLDPVLGANRVILCPPFVYSREVGSILSKSKTISLGAQDVFWEESGSHTGEVGPSMLKNVGVTTVIIGHSETRARGVTDEQVLKKVRASLKASLDVILCVGESERDAHGNYLGFIEQELRTNLKGIESKYLKKIIIAYEPIWAIGKKDTEAMKPREVHEMSIFIKKVISDMYGPEYGLKIPILYGGSVSGRNAGAIVYDGAVDGLLVGRQSIDPESFKEIIEAVTNPITL